MPFGEKRPNTITEADLQALKDNEVRESKTVDYKSALPGNSDEEKREFLSDVSSFANAAGGYLIFGIEEEQGIPVNICGLGNINSNDQILRLENIILNGIEPRIPGLTIHPIACGNSTVILIYIPRSWASPHMVTFKNYSRFYSRNSAGKYQLDVSELRALFLLSETTAEKIRGFRADRLGKIIAGETPIAIDDTAKIVLHIVPLDAFNPATRVDVYSNVPRGHSLYAPIYCSNVSWDRQYNFDGLLTFWKPRQEDPAHSYLQVFHSGIIEAVDAYILQPNGSKLILRDKECEQALIEGLQRFTDIQRHLAVEPPFFVMLSLLGVSGYVIPVFPGPSFFSGLEYNVHPIDRDNLVIPEIVLEDFDYEADKVLRPLFDAVWNAAGWPQSLNYDENGNWRQRPR